MSNDIAKYTKAANVALSDNDTKNSVGGTLLKTGLGGGALYLAAGVIPFVTFPMLLVLFVLAGGYLKYIK